MIRLGSDGYNAWVNAMVVIQMMRTVRPMIVSKRHLALQPSGGRSCVLE